MAIKHIIVKHMAVISCCVLNFSCSQEELGVKFPENYGFPNSAYTYKNNPISKEKIQLGRFLFYDPILSLDSTVHCGSCDTPEHAFADHNVALSFQLLKKKHYLIF